MTIIIIMQRNNDSFKRQLLCIVRHRVIRVCTGILFHQSKGKIDDKQKVEYENFFDIQNTNIAAGQSGLIKKQVSHSRPNIFFLHFVYQPFLTLRASELHDPKRNKEKRKATFVSGPGLLDSGRKIRSLANKSRLNSEIVNVIVYEDRKNIEKLWFLQLK